MKKSQFMIEDLVYEVLKTNIKAREDDFELVLGLYKILCPPLLEISFGGILKEHKEYELPSFESITRARRKIQSQHQELVSQKTLRKRNQLCEEYKEYYSQY